MKIFQKVQNWRNWILSVPRVSVCREKKSPWLRQYQSYISNWHVNGKVFTSTTTWEPKNLIFFFSKKFEIEFDVYFDSYWRAEIIQVGLNMHLYVDIGDASSSLWGSTSSFFINMDHFWKWFNFTSFIPSLNRLTNYRFGATVCANVRAKATWQGCFNTPGCMIVQL